MSGCRRSKGVYFSKYSSRGDPESKFPYFMQNYSNRQSLQLVMQKSLAQSNYSSSNFIP